MLFCTRFSFLGLIVALAVRSDGPINGREPAPITGATGQPRVDLFGDPLPNGAVARMGTRRWHHHDSNPYFALSPDGKTAATAGGDQTPEGDRILGVIHLWEMETGKETRQLPGYGPLAFSPDGKTLASTERQPGLAVRLRDVATGKDVAMLRGFKNRVGVIYSPDGKTLATVAEENSTYLFDVATGKLRHKLLGQLPAFSPDGIEIVTRDERVPSDQTFYFWDVKTGKQRHALKEREKWSSGCVIAADGKTLITGRDRIVQWCDRATGKEIRQVQGSLLAASAKGDRVAIQDKNGIQLCDEVTGKKLLSFPPHIWAWQAVFSGDGKILAVVDDNAILEFDTATGKELRPVPGHSGRLPFVGFTPDGKQLITAGDATMRFWDVRTGKESAQDRAGKPALPGAALTADGRTVVLRLDGGNLSFRDVWSGEQIRQVEWPAHGGYNAEFAISANQKVVAKVKFGDGYQRITLWDTATGQKITQFVDPANKEGDSERVNAMVFSPDGKIFAALSDKIVLWDVATGKRLPQVLDATIIRYPWVSGNSTVAFSPDGKILATGCNKKDVGLWEVASGRAISCLYRA